MGRTMSDALVDRLRQWGVRRIYGFPGDGINGILGAIQRVRDEIDFIQVRHEEMAAFMACGHAKFSGEVGVCLATSGPGAIHLLNGLYDARMDHQAVVAIVGQAARSAMGSAYQQEVDLMTLFKDVAAQFVQTLTSPEQLPMLVDRAMRVAAAERTVTCIIVPKDIQEFASKEVPHKHDVAPGSLGYSMPRILPQETDLRRAARVLNEGRKVAMLIGQGARGAGREVIEVAELLGAGVAKALLGKDVIPDDLPFVTGSIGLLGSKASYELMMGCDTFLMVGSNLPYAEFLPKYGQARGVQIDIDPKIIGLRYPMEVQLVGDSRETLRALLPMLERKTDRAWRMEIEDNVREWWSLVRARAMEEAHPLNPQRVFWELSERLPDNVIVTCDSGSGANWYARDLKIREGMMCSLSGTLATMGSGVPYAIAAKFAHPDRPVVAIAGDGAMQMNGLAELLTVAKYRDRWADPRLVVLVLHNNDLNQVTWEMRAIEGNPKFEASQDIPDMDYAKFADLVGLRGLRLDSPDQIRSVLDAALTADRPVIIDAVVDPNVAPLPPHITFKQARALLSSLLKGDPDAAEVVRHSFKGKIKEFIPPGNGG